MSAEMKRSAGAACSSCLASAELAPQEILGAVLPVSLVQGAAMSSSAFLRLAAAKITRPPAWARAIDRGATAVASARPSHSRLFMPHLLQEVGIVFRIYRFVQRRFTESALRQAATSRIVAIPASRTLCAG